MRRIATTSVLAVAILLLAGCSEGIPRATVEGTVTLDGTPVEHGVVSFTPIGETRGPSTQVTVKDGKYSLEQREGPIVGSNRVEILVYRKTGKKVPDMTQKGVFIDEITQAAPPRYNSKSTLDRTLNPGQNTLNFDLDGKAK
ncbi:MAG: hypothetical protein K8U57_09625 [Planctomycetes bacterium]|nr:hypothetical protein [Planctomycetota bacterium]